MNDTRHDAWWTIHSFDIQNMLQRAHEGEDPDLLYVEMIANSETDYVPPKDDS